MAPFCQEHSKARWIYNVNRQSPRTVRLFTWEVYTITQKHRGLLQRLGNKWFKSIKIYISFLPIHSKSSIIHNPEHTRCKSAKKSPLKYKSFQVYHPITSPKCRAETAPIYTHNTISGNLSCLFKVIYSILWNCLLKLWATSSACPHALKWL